MKTNGKLEIHETVSRIPLDRVHISDYNTRHPSAKEPGIIELARSLKETGQTTPAIVREHPKKKGHYELAAGARRYVGLPLAGIPTINAIIRKFPSDDAFEELILLENLQREDPDPKAEIKLLDRIVKRGIATASAISAHLGKPEHWVQRRLKLLDVIEGLRKEWDRTDGRGLGIQHYTVEMMAMLGALPKPTQESFLERNQYKQFENDLNRCETVAELRKYLDQEVSCLLSAAPFDLNDPRFFVKGCGPGCASDSSKQSGLFDFGTTPKDARCLNCTCFHSRLGKFRQIALEEAAKKAVLPLALVEKLPLIHKGDYYANGPGEIQIGSKTIKPDSVGYSEKIVGADYKGKGKQQRVLVVSKDGLRFRIGYVVSTGAAGGSQKSKPKVSAKEGLAIRKALLQARRWDSVRKELIDTIMASKHKDLTVDVVDLVAVFGTIDKQRPERGGKKEHNTNWDIYDNRKKKGFICDTHSDKINYLAYDPFRDYGLTECDTVTFKDRNEALWHLVKRVIVAQLMGIVRVGDITTENVVYDIERVGKLISFPVAAKKKEADLAIRPAKSWGKVDVHTLEPIK